MQVLRSQFKSDNVTVSRTFNVAASQTINVGDLLQIDPTSRLLAVAVAASTSIAGIAEQAITTSASPLPTDVCSITMIRGEVIRMAVDQSGAKKTFAVADKFLTGFDLMNKTSVNPNVTSQMCFVQDFNNTNLTVDVVFAPANIANIG